MHKRLVGLLASAAIIAAACGGATSSSAPASVEPGVSAEPGASAEASAPPAGGLAADQILYLDNAGEPPTLDPTMAQDSASLSILRALHRPLVYIDKDTNVVPALAEKYDVSADGKTLTFTLRDAKYSNGEQIVAGDLMFSFKRLIDPRTAAPYSYVMCEIAGATTALGGACGGEDLADDAAIDAALANLGIAAPDDKTFVITLERPATYFLSTLTLWVAVPMQEKWITAPGATEAANYVSSGPFILDTWEHNSEIILKPNPNWYGDVKPTLTEVHFSMIVDAAARQAAYESGAIDVQGGVPVPDVDRVKNDPTLSAEYSENSGLSIAYYNFNNAKGPTANKNFRIALTQAIDKQALVTATYAGLGKIANVPVMDGLPGYDATIDPYPFNVDAAKAAMALALDELQIPAAEDADGDGDTIKERVALVNDGQPLKFGYNTEGTHNLRVAFLAQAWDDAFGLKTQQIGSEFGVFLTERHQGLYDIARNGWGADYPHANNQLTGLHTCGGGNNDQQYCNPAFDELLVQAAAEPDQAKQADIYKQAQTLLMADAPMLPLIYSVTPILIRPWVTGVTQTPMDSQNPGEHFYETIQILAH